MAIATGNFPKAIAGGKQKREKKKTPVGELGMMFAKVKRKSGS